MTSAVAVVSRERGPTAQPQNYQRSLTSCSFLILNLYDLSHVHMLYSQTDRNHLNTI